jgi:parallel beta-helix repeat protein
VKGASGAGINVGRSKNIIVRDSTASGNVAGIKIENGRHADILDNLATYNAAARMRSF